MQRGAFLIRLLLALTLVGLVAMPVQDAGAAAKATAMALAFGDMEMPCCPQGQPMKADCMQDCPEAAICAATGLAPAHLPHASFKAESLADGIFAPFVEAAAASLAGEPPPRPPRT
jgi:hypothetical protein